MSSMVVTVIIVFWIIVVLVLVVILGDGIAENSGCSSSRHGDSRVHRLLWPSVPVVAGHASDTAECYKNDERSISYNSVFSV